jgi:Fe2+ transport system protein FeoA
MNQLQNRSSGDSATTVRINPPDIVRRRVTAWGGVRAEVIEVIRRDRFEYKFHAPHHLLVMSERASRDMARRCLMVCRHRRRGISAAN